MGIDYGLAYGLVNYQIQLTEVFQMWFSNSQKVIVLIYLCQGWKLQHLVSMDDAHDFLVQED